MTKETMNSSRNTLKIARATPADAAARPPKPSNPAMMTRKILVCEDDPVLSMDMAAQIAALGHRPLGPVSNAAAALDVADMEKPDAAFIDLNLADGRSGLAIAREMHGRGVPVILCSGDTLAPLELRDIKHVYIVKPLVEGLLASCLAGIFAEPQTAAA